MRIETRLLWGRLFTRAGDQAWDFALPLTLLALWPGRLDLASLFYLGVKALSLLLTPRIAGLIDTRSRRWVTRWGLGLQFLGVLGSLVGLSLIGDPRGDLEFLFFFAALTCAGVLGSLGAILMDIAIAADLAPSLFVGDALTRFNSRFRQVDLATEVGAPVAAGLLIVAFTSPLYGFAAVAAWNMISFLPEWLILDSVFRDRPELSRANVQISTETRLGFAARVRAGYALFRTQRVAPVMIAYSLLWVSALSPHGVLLTGFLKDAWQLPEWQIGLFRGAGAFFGLAATFLFPLAYRRFGLTRAAGIFLGFQTITVVGAGLAFARAEFFALTSFTTFAFLGAVLFSRIGLYGFMLGETQLRQESIAAGERGRVNGFASVLNNAMTFVLLGLASLLPQTGDFKWLILLSVGAVLLAFLIYLGASARGKALESA